MQDQVPRETTIHFLCLFLVGKSEQSLQMTDQDQRASTLFDSCQFSSYYFGLIFWLTLVFPFVLIVALPPCHMRDGRVFALFHRHQIVYPFSVIIFSWRVGHTNDTRVQYF